MVSVTLQRSKSVSTLRLLPSLIMDISTYSVWISTPQGLLWIEAPSKCILEDYSPIHQGAMQHDRTHVRELLVKLH